MQNAKDTFYEVLRERVAAANAARTVVVRGVTRPAVVVEENELIESGTLLECFRLRWTALKNDVDSAAPLCAMVCEIRYATKGTGAGMDRGRALAAMDQELAAAVECEPKRAVKKNFAALANGGAVSTMASCAWWSDVAFGAAESKGATLERVAKLTVYSYEEAGEA